MIPNAKFGRAAMARVVVSVSLLAGGIGALGGCAASGERAAAHDGPDLIEAPGVVMSVEGLGCPMCAESIYILLGNVDGVSDSTVSLDSGTVDVVFEPGAAVSRAALARAVTDGGFSFRGLEVKE
jgi:copper chaperone CopZ